MSQTEFVCHEPISFNVQFKPDYTEMFVGGQKTIRTEEIPVAQSTSVEAEHPDAASHRVLARTGGFISQDRAAQQRVQTTESAAAHFPDRDNPNPAPGK